MSQGTIYRKFCKSLSRGTSKNPLSARLVREPLLFRWMFIVRRRAGNRPLWTSRIRFWQHSGKRAFGWTRWCRCKWRSLCQRLGFDCFLVLTSINSSCGTSINANKFMSHFGVLVPVVTCVFLVLRSCNNHWRRPASFSMIDSPPAAFAMAFPSEALYNEKPSWRVVLFHKLIGFCLIKTASNLRLSNNESWD